MATALAKGKVTREAALRLKARPIIVTISPATPGGLDDKGKYVAAQPEHVELRLKGTQQRWTVPLADLVTWAQRRQW